jgi:hypothetical protein
MTITKTINVSKNTYNDLMNYVYEHNLCDNNIIYTKTLNISDTEYVIEVTTIEKHMEDMQNALANENLFFNQS